MLAEGLGLARPALLTRRYGPLAGVIVALWAAVAVLVFLSFSSTDGQAVLTLAGRPHILLFLAAVAITYLWRRWFRPAPAVTAHHGRMAWVVVGATLVQAELGSLGTRYETYLIVGATLALAMGVFGAGGFPRGAPSAFASRRFRPDVLVATVIAGFVVVPLGGHAVKLTMQTGSAMRSLYEQPYQVGLFLRRFYTGAVVVAHDVGAINYLANIRCIDADGLGTLEVARARPP